MKNIFILVSGMPATGKSTFAAWLSSKIERPLVSYDNIKDRAMEIAKSNCENEDQLQLFDGISYGFLCFIMEEIMKSGCVFIVDYIFSDKMHEKLNEMTSKYEYDTINVHFDADTKIAYERFTKRNIEVAQASHIRPTEIPFERFCDGTKQNKDFRYGNRVIYLDSTDFTSLSYDTVFDQIILHIKEMSEDTNESNC